MGCSVCKSEEKIRKNHSEEPEHHKEKSLHENKAHDQRNDKVESRSGVKEIIPTANVAVSVPLERKPNRVVRSSLKSEVLVIGAGKTGANNTLSFFEEICREHNLLNGGLESEERLIENLNTFFSIDRRGEIMARCVLIDSGQEDFESLLNEYTCQKFIYNNNLLKNSTNTLGLHAVAKMQNNDLNTDAMDCIRKEAEKCDNFSGVHVHSNSGGGAGTGYSLSVLDYLQAQFGSKINTLVNTILPSSEKLDTFSTVNTLISLASSYQKSTLTNICNNDDMLFLAKTLPMTYSLVGKLFADLTSLERFASYYTQEQSLKLMMKSVVPYPNTNFTTSAVIFPIDLRISEDQIVEQLFDDKKSLGFIDSMSDEKLVASSQIFRGGLNSYEIERAIIKKKSSFKTTECLGLCNSFSNPNGLRDLKSCARLTNHTSIRLLLGGIAGRVEKMDKQGPELQKYYELGIEPGEVLESIESIFSVCESYKEFLNS